MIESEFAFFEMEKEVFATNAAAFRQPGFRRAPEALNAVDVDAAAPDKDAVAMFDAEVFAVAEVHQAVVADPAVRMNDAGEGDAAANNRPQSGLFRIGDDLGIHAPAAFENPEHDGLAASTATSFPPNPASTEVRLIDFDGPAHGGVGFAFPRHTNTQRVEEAINGSATDVSELRHFRGLEVEREEADDLAEFRLRNM